MDMGRATYIFYPFIPFFQKAYLTLTSQQCGPGSNPSVDAICGLSLLLVFSLTPRGFSPDTSVFPSPLKPTLSNSNSIWNARTRFSEFLRTPKCSVEAGDFYYQKDEPSCVIHWKEI